MTTISNTITLSNYLSGKVRIAEMGDGMFLIEEEILDRKQGYIWIPHTNDSYKSGFKSYDKALLSAQQRAKDIKNFKIKNSVRTYHEITI